MPSTELKVAYDTYDIDDEKYTIDPETGFLHINMTLTKEGVMYYPQNNERRYLPGGVIKQALDSLALIPITKMHPREGLVDSNNYRSVTRGEVAPGAVFDGEYVRAKGVVKDSELINDIMSKRINQVSLGYKYAADGCPGKVKLKGQEEEYDTCYTYVKYNHVSGVPLGRAGSDVRFEIDQKGEDMPDIEKELSGLKVGNDELLPSQTITFPGEIKATIDSMYDREKKLAKIAQDQAEEIKTLKASLAVNKESLDTLKTAQDGMVAKSDLNAMTAELLDAREVALKVGVDCATETDSHVIRKKVLEKMQPAAYKALQANDSVDDNNAIKAAYAACKENLGFNIKVQNTTQALDGHQGLKITQPTGTLYRTFGDIPR